MKPFSARELVARVGTHLEMAKLRREAAMALHQSEKRFRELADNAPVVIWVANDCGNVEFVNRTYLKYFAISLADVAGRGWKVLIHPDDHESYCKKFLAAAAAGRRFRAECRVRRGDGEWRWVDSWAVPRSSESERRSGMVGCNVDVTERVQAEERIRELGAIVEFSEDVAPRLSVETSLNGNGSSRSFGKAKNDYERRMNNCKCQVFRGSGVGARRCGH
jgi:PAS domain S-box-containing protein